MIPRPGPWHLCSCLCRPHPTRVISKFHKVGLPRELSWFTTSISLWFMVLIITFFMGFTNQFITGRVPDSRNPSWPFGQNRFRYCFSHFLEIFAMCPPRLRWFMIYHDLSTIYVYTHIYIYICLCLCLCLCICICMYMSCLCVCNYVLSCIVSIFIGI